MLRLPRLHGNGIRQRQGVRLVCEHVRGKLHAKLSITHRHSLHRTAVAGLSSWFGISVTYIRFHRGLKAQGINRKTLPFYSPLQPFAAWYAAIGCFLIALVRDESLTSSQRATQLIHDPSGMPASPHPSYHFHCLLPLPCRYTRSSADGRCS